MAFSFSTFSEIIFTNGCLDRGGTVDPLAPSEFRKLLKTCYIPHGVLLKSVVVELLPFLSLGLRRFEKGLLGLLSVIERGLCSRKTKGAYRTLVLERWLQLTGSTEDSGT